MCKHGEYKRVKVIQQRLNQEVLVDSCIAGEIEMLNQAGVVTVGSCCGHGHPDEFPHALIDQQSVKLVQELNYQPEPYFHGTNDFRGLYKIRLKRSGL